MSFLKSLSFKTLAGLADWQFTLSHGRMRTKRIFRQPLRFFGFPSKEKQRLCLAVLPSPAHSTKHRSFLNGRIQNLVPNQCKCWNSPPRRSRCRRSRRRAGFGSPRGPSRGTSPPGTCVWCGTGTWTPQSHRSEDARAKSGRHMVMLHGIPRDIETTFECYISAFV